MDSRETIAKLRAAELVNAAAWLICHRQAFEDDLSLALEVLRDAVRHVDRSDAQLAPIIEAVEAYSAHVAAHGWTRLAFVEFDLSVALGKFFRWRVGAAQAALRAQAEAAA